MKVEKEKRVRQEEQAQEEQFRLKTDVKAGCNALLQTGDYEGYGRCMAGGQRIPNWLGAARWRSEDQLQNRRQPKSEIGLPDGKTV